MKCTVRETTFIAPIAFPLTDPIHSIFRWGLTMPLGFLDRIHSFIAVQDWSHLTHRRFSRTTFTLRARRPTQSLALTSCFPNLILRLIRLSRDHVG